MSLSYAEMHAVIKNKKERLPTIVHIYQVYLIYYDLVIVPFEAFPLLGIFFLFCLHLMILETF